MKAIKLQGIIEDLIAQYGELSTIWGNRFRISQKHKANNKRR